MRTLSYLAFVLGICCAVVSLQAQQAPPAFFEVQGEWSTNPGNGQDTIIVPYTAGTAFGSSWSTPFVSGSLTGNAVSVTYSTACNSYELEGISVFVLGPPGTPYKIQYAYSDVSEATFFAYQQAAMSEVGHSSFLYYVLQAPPTQKVNAANVISGVTYSDTTTYSGATYSVAMVSSLHDLSYCYDGDSASEFTTIQLTLNPSNQTLVGLSGDGQAGSVSTPLANPVVIKVTDQNGAPVPGTSIGFQITQQPQGASGASLSASNATTAADGTASTQLTLGSLAGQYQVTGSCVVGNCSPNSVVFTATATLGLSAPTNLHADQLPGGNGTQIQLTWDYSTDPVDGFIIERQTPSERLAGAWEPPLPLTPSQGTPGQWYVIDTSATQYATYNYRVRAYKGSDESANSNESACFQVQLYIIGHTMLANFQPDYTLSLRQAASAFNYDHFNWINQLTSYVEVDPVIWPKEILRDWNNQIVQPPAIDPPYTPCSPVTGFSGWSYVAADCSIPYYWNETSGPWSPTLNLDFAGDPINYPGYPANTTTNSTLFHDLPSVQIGLLDHKEFATTLVGAMDPEGTFVNGSTALASFTWGSNYGCYGVNLGTCLGIGVGGIDGYSLNYNVVDPNIPGGQGAAFNARTVDLSDLPLSVRTELIQAGIHGVSTSAKVDKDAPMTAAFLSGPQGTNGWYTGPVQVVLIATDIDGPTDVAATYYTLDGGSQVTYSAPFNISSDGVHHLSFDSVDQAGNQEKPNLLTVQIDATPPTITTAASPSSVWPPNGKMVPVTISGAMTDNLSGLNASTAAFAVTDEYGQVQPSGPVTVGNIGSYSFVINLQASRDGNDKDGRQYTIKVTAQDNAGNQGSASTVVTVPHDQGQ